MVEEQVLKQVGFTYVLDKLKIVTPYGRDELKGIKPFKSDEIKACRLMLSDVEKFFVLFKQKEGLCEELVEILTNFKDLRKTCKRLTEGFVLDDVELFELKNFSLNLKKLLSIYEKANVKVDSVVFAPMQTVINLLNPNDIVVSSFHIYDVYSQDLRRIRKEKLNILELLKKEPENEMFKNDRARLVLQEQEEEFRVREELSFKLTKYARIMMYNMLAIGKLDLLISKARIANEYRTCIPEILESGGIEIKGAVNIEVNDNLCLQNKEFVGVDICLKEGVSLLTGANMGGKTVALSTVVLNVLLVTYGFLPFAKEFRCGLVDFVMFVSGDLQNKNRGISSFGAEVLELSKLCKFMQKAKGLVVFDEFARNTNPLEGQRFVRALCEMLSEKASYGLVSTHYDSVLVKGAWYYRVIGLRDDLIEKFDSEDKVGSLSGIMDYRIKRIDEGDDVPKDAFKVAKLLGVGDEFLDRLKKFYGGEAK